MEFLKSNSVNKVVITDTNLDSTVHWTSLLREVKRILKKEPASRLIVGMTKESEDKFKRAVREIEGFGFKHTRMTSVAREVDADSKVLKLSGIAFLRLS